MDLSSVSFKNIKFHHYAQVIGIIIVAIILVYLVFAYFYFSEDQKINQIMDKYHQMKLPELETTTKDICLDKYSSYYLSDFYIASSAKTFLIGNQKYDYTSLEMIKNALIMGARYIELEILNDSVGLNAKPVVTTGYQQGQWQTSLNYIDFEETCQTIAEFAFSQEVKTHPWPLFIYLHLQVNNNPRSLRQITKILNQTFPDSREEPLKVGNRFPAELNPASTRICSLFGQVVIWSDPIETMDWVKNDLEVEEKYYQVVNKNTPLRLHFTEVSQYQGEQEKKEKEGKTPEEHRRESDPLTEHNRQGLSIVYPSTSEDSQSLNYPPTEAWSYGCQFVAINYQIADHSRQVYFNKFLKDSFVLKPNGLRVLQESQKVISLDSLVPDQRVNRDQIRYRLPDIYDDQPIYLRPVDDLTKVLSHGQNYLEVIEKPVDQITLEECFLIKESLSHKPDQISLVAAKRPYQYLSITDHTLIMEDWRVKKMDRDQKDVFVKNSALIPMNGFTISRASSEKDDQEGLLSFYVSGLKKDILTYHHESQELILRRDDPQDFELAQEATFQVYKLPVKRMYTIRKSNGLFFQPVGQLIKATSQTLSDDSFYEFINESDTGLTIPMDKKYNYIHIKNKNGGYWTILDKFKLRTTATQPGKFTRFYLQKIGSIYKIFYGGDRRELPLYTQSDGIIRLAQNNEKNKAETFFILDKSYAKKEA